MDESPLILVIIFVTQIKGGYSPQLYAVKGTAGHNMIASLPRSIS